MKLTWQTDATLQITALSPNTRDRLMVELAGQTVTLERLVGTGGPSDFGVIAHEWAMLGERVHFDIIFSDGWYAATVEPLYGVCGAIVGVQGNAQPVADRRAADRRAAINAHAEALSGSGSWYYDAITGECEWSDGLYQLLGADVWMPFSRDIRSFDAPEDVRTIELALSRSRLAREPYKIEHRVRRADGSIRFVQESAELYFDPAGVLTHVIGTMLDITERRVAESRLAHLAYHDSVSDLPNRALLEERFETALQRARPNRNLCGLIFIDIDGFKVVNDSLGHAHGDDLLRAIAARLKCHVRSEDTLARFGGDEFVILLDSILDEREAERIGRTILEVFEEPFVLGANQVCVKASVGIAFAPPDGTTLQAVLAAADSAMYAAKHRGGNCIATTFELTDQEQLVG